MPARSIGAALSSLGLEIWLDESALGGGDAWDQKIRRQIRECHYFMPIVSARTENRHEGYFRREWRLAVERTLDLADGSGSGSGSRDEPDISKADARKIQSIAEGYRGSTHPADVARLGRQIAEEFAAVSPNAAGPRAILAIPFAAPSRDAAAAKVADAAFAQAYGRLSISHRGGVALEDDATASSDAHAALARARAAHAAWVVYGAVPPGGSEPALRVTIANAEDGSVVWTRSFPIRSADPLEIAAQVDARIPRDSGKND